MGIKDACIRNPKFWKITMHYYPFNVKDYTYDTQHLSLAEHGALRLLIDRIHLKEKPLDSDETEI